MNGIGMDRHLQQVQTRTSQIMSNVFNASTTCLRELARVVEGTEAIDLLLDVFNCSRTALNESQSQSSSWWSSNNNVDGNGQNTTTTNNTSTNKNTNTNTNNNHQGNSLDRWVNWINAKENLEQKNKLRARIGALLAPVYKATESTLKRAIKTTGKIISKHNDRHEKVRKRELEDQKEHEDKWNRNRGKSTQRLSQRLKEAQQARSRSLFKGRKSHDDLCHLDAFYDKELFQHQWETLGAVDPWELICEFQTVDDN